ncbi:hypothetical protein M422DRAFT_44246 [Sphaerobolus stellatus SS14]|nr:hypothetical protein M422DRAFT_44246 [Sphaerobolus stellatus SS14]
MTNSKSMDSPKPNGDAEHTETDTREESPSDTQNNSAEYDSDKPPTAEAWNTMKRYGSFITHDEQEVEHTFHLNDIIYVLPSGRDPDEEVDKKELWLAQIKSIRAFDSHSVWIRAKWFYNARELPKRVKGASAPFLLSRKAKDFGSLERISSNQADFIPTSTCCGHASIIYYDEQDLEQKDIEPDAFYYRCDYDWQKQTLTRSSFPCSVCKKIYNPDTDVMHFCPRPNCQKAWHIQCLEKNSWFIKSPENFEQRTESLDHYISSGATPSPKKKKARTKSKPLSTTATTPAESDAYSHIPAALLAVARQPIARGGKLGIVGNVRSVTRARKMVQDALAGAADIPDDWAEKLGKVFDANLLGPSDETKQKTKALSYQCPSCGEPI